MENFKTYLGDSVYADFNGYAIILYLNNGHESHNFIYLGPREMDALLKYKERTDNERRKYLSDNKEST